MSTKSKIVNIKTGEIKRVNLHPSANEIYKKALGALISFRQRCLAIKRAGFDIVNRSMYK